MREALEEAMKPGHLRWFFWCIDNERAFLARHFGSLDALRDSFITEPPEPPAAGDGASSRAAGKAAQADAREARRRQAEAARQAARRLREVRTEEKRVAEGARLAAREQAALLREFEAAQCVNASGQPVDEWGELLAGVANGVDLRVEKAAVWLRHEPRDREKYGFDESWGLGDFRGRIVELCDSHARFSLPQLSQPKMLPLSMVERVHLSGRRQRAMRAQGEAFLSSLGRPVPRRHLVMGPQGAAPPHARLRCRGDPPRPPPDLPHYDPRSLGPRSGTRPPPPGADRDVEAVHIWGEASIMKSRHVGPGGAGVTWFVRGWRFRLESRRNDPRARDMYIWPPEAHSERGLLVKHDLCRVRSMREMGRLLLGRMANLADGWRPPAHGAIVELQRHGGWEQGRVDAVRGDGAFLVAASSQPHRLKWFIKQGEGREWRRTAAAGVHLGVAGGRVRLLLSSCSTRTCDVSRDADPMRRRGQWHRCTFCYKWRRAVGLTMADAVVRCVVDCDVPQELSDAQIDEELGIPPWHPMSSEHLHAASAANEGPLVAGAEVHAAAEVLMAAEVRVSAAAGGELTEELIVGAESTGRADVESTGASPLPAFLAEVFDVAADQGVLQAGLGRLVAEVEVRAHVGVADEQPPVAGVGMGAPVAEMMDVTSNCSEAEVANDLVEGGVLPDEHDVEMAEGNGASVIEPVGGDGAVAAVATVRPCEVVDLTCDLENESSQRSPLGHARTNTGRVFICISDEDDDE